MESTAKMARAISPWCNRAARKAATTVGSAAFRPLFIPGMASASLHGSRCLWGSLSSVARPACNYEP